MGVRSMKEDVKKILYKQLELLAEDSKKNGNLIDNSKIMMEIAQMLSWM